MEFPKYPYQAMRSILLAEAAAAFDDLTRSGRDKLLTQQTRDDWPNTFRSARFIPAVEYIQANRARTTAMELAAKVFEQVDVIVAPTFSTQLLITNLTGHPALILPNGFRGEDAPKPRVHENGEVDAGGPGTPLSLTFLGQLYGEARMLALAKAYQDATDFHRKHPQLECGAEKIRWKLRNLPRQGSILFTYFCHSRLLPVCDINLFAQWVPLGACLRRLLPQYRKQYVLFRK